MIRAHNLFSILALLIALLLLIAACAKPVAPAPSIAPRLSLPAAAAQPCRVTATPVATLADLETRDRARGVDVWECDGRRALAVEAFNLQLSLLDRYEEARERRASRVCRWFGLRCE